MQVTLYYFSGTGNSYAIARNIADAIHGELIPMASVVMDKEIVTEANCIGIIFPVYYMDAPNIIRKFIPKLADLSSKYVFVVCTYGGGQGHTFKTVKKLLNNNGGRLAAAYGIHMPQNAFFKPKDNPEKIYACAENMVKLICNRTEKRLRGYRTTNPLILSMVMGPLTPILKSVTRRYFIKALQCVKDVSDTELINRMDQSFGVNGNCTGCGQCVQVCPVANIDMEEGRPTWTHCCENCLACYDLCPNKAITSQIVQKGYYYLHPVYSAKAAKIQSRKVK